MIGKQSIIILTKNDTTIAHCSEAQLEWERKGRFWVKRTAARNTPRYTHEESRMPQVRCFSHPTHAYTPYSIYLSIYLNIRWWRQEAQKISFFSIHSCFFLPIFFSFLPFFTVCVCYIHPFSSVIFVYAMTATNSMNRRRKKSPHKYGKWRRGKKLCVCKIEKEKDGSIKGWVSWGNEWYEDRKWKYSCF